MEALAHPRDADAPRLANLIRRMKAQRVSPIQNLLAASEGRAAVRHLVILPSTFMVRIPIELLVDDLTVSYAPSATVLTYLTEKPPVESRGLVALGDPIFARDLSPEKTSPPPDHGLLIDVVPPRSNAAKAKPLALASGDVLLSYNGMELRAIDDLTAAKRDLGPTEWVRLRLWREGTVHETEMPGGDLGVIVNREPAPAALARARKIVESLAAGERGDEKYPPLPGSRLEVEAIRKLFLVCGSSAHILLGPDASEQRLSEVRGRGELARARYIHLATHGIINSRRPLDSALILSHHAPAGPGDPVREGRPQWDDRLTAGEVLRDWQLGAEMVTLSACRTALGKHEIGEGFIGFSQPFLLAGSRSVCMSLWATDDGATALFMNRFYENILGTRDDLKDRGPMSKAAALAEARQWLRELPLAQALSALARISGGVVRGEERPARIHPNVVDRGQSAARSADPPFAHPYYWAPFILVGDPG
jgi:hypothetical protein